MVTAWFTLKKLCRDIKNCIIIRFDNICFSKKIYEQENDDIAVTENNRSSTVLDKFYLLNHGKI